MVNQLAALHDPNAAGAMAAFGGGVETLAGAHLRFGGLAKTINLVFFGF